MDTITPFLHKARHQGFSTYAARNAYYTIEARLEGAGYPGTTTFYIYRIVQPKDQAERKDDPQDAGKQESHNAASDHAHEPNRLLLVFSSPDSALAFAQHQRLRPTPRVLSVRLAHLLIALMQHPTIRALIFTEETAAISPETRIPTMFHLDREELLDMLKGSLL
jgi:hypothetical protein